MGSFDGVKLVTRECGKGVGIDGCRSRILGGGATATICSCAGDLCNITAAESPSTFLSLAVVLISSLFLLVIWLDYEFFFVIL